MPKSVWLRHEYCYFVHDQCVAMLKEYEEHQPNVVTIRFKSKAETQRFNEIADATNSFNAMREIGHPNKAKRVILYQITMAVSSDCLLHIYEALSCLERRKSVVAINLLRKPLMDSLLYLSWMLGDEDAFYDAFASGNPELIAQRRIRNNTKNILSAGLAKTKLDKIIDTNDLHALLYDSKNPYGLYGLFQHAVHLVTIERPELRTSPENFNFIFKNPSDDDTYETLYDVLPVILLYLTHVIAALFDRIKKMDKGSRAAFNVRTQLGFRLAALADDVPVVCDILTKALSDVCSCVECETPAKFTPYNAALALFTDTHRCVKCRTVSGFPFSWFFRTPARQMASKRLSDAMK